MGQHILVGDGGDSVMYCNKRNRPQIENDIKEKTMKKIEISEKAATRMLISIQYTPFSRRVMNYLVDRFSVRKHKKANPDIDPDSDEFNETLPEMPPLVCKVYDSLNNIEIRTVDRWVRRYERTGKYPSKIYLYHK